MLSYNRLSATSVISSSQPLHPDMMWVGTELYPLYNDLSHFLEKSDKIYYRNLRYKAMGGRFSQISVYFFVTRIMLRNFAS